MKKEYTWNKKELLKEYKSILRNKNNEYKKHDKDSIKEMIHTLVNKRNMFDVSYNMMFFKNELNYEEYYTNCILTDFQKQNIEKVIATIKNNEILYMCVDDDMEFDRNYTSKDEVNNVKQFLLNFNIYLYNCFNDVVDNNRLYIDDSKSNERVPFDGCCYSVNNKNYYQITNRCSNNLFLIMLHENVHGFINKLTNKKFTKNNELKIYEEIGSILIELYGNKYLRDNKIITEDEYLYHLNTIYTSNLDYDIEIADFLYRLSKSETNKSIKNVKKIINEEREKNSSYDFKIKELAEYPLDFYLIYLYSAAIAISLYEKYKNNGKKGMEAALDIMLNINQENEEEYLKKYNINFEKPLKKFAKRNNRLIKKKTN